MLHLAKCITKYAIKEIRRRWYIKKWKSSQAKDRVVVSLLARKLTRDSLLDTMQEHYKALPLDQLMSFSPSLITLFLWSKPTSLFTTKHLKTLLGTAPNLTHFVKRSLQRLKPGNYKELRLRWKERSSSLLKHKRNLENSKSKIN